MNLLHILKIRLDLEFSTPPFKKTYTLQKILTERAEPTNNLWQILLIFENFAALEFDECWTRALQSDLVFKQSRLHNSFFSECSIPSLFPD